MLPAAPPTHRCGGEDRKAIRSAICRVTARAMAQPSAMIASRRRSVSNHRRAARRIPLPVTISLVIPTVWQTAAGRSTVMNTSAGVVLRHPTRGARASRPPAQVHRLPSCPAHRRDRRAGSSGDRVVQQKNADIVTICDGRFAAAGRIVAVLLTSDIRPRGRRQRGDRIDRALHTRGQPGGRRGAAARAADCPLAARSGDRMRLITFIGTTTRGNALAEQASHRSHRRQGRGW